MTDHRGSYLKTAICMGCVAVSGVGAIAYSAYEISITSDGRLVQLTAWSVLMFILLCFQTGISLVFAGALIVLRRDRLERLGLPYAGRPREWHGGFIVRTARTIFRNLRWSTGRRPGQLDLRAGEAVKIRSREEILQTLDAKGELESLPFMPEMEAFYGRQARVHRRVDKVFDWITSSGLRRMQDTVILEGLRCDGADHDGCQADCPILWKEAWLTRVSDGPERGKSSNSGAATEVDLHRFTTRIDEATSETRFVCQLCKLPEATTPTPWNNPRNLLRELLSGNVRLGPFLTFIAIFAFNAVQKKIRGSVFPILGHSNLPKTPHQVLNIQPGELVRIRTKHEIEQTLNAEFKNRGLWFDKEMTRFCGGTYKVRARVNRQIDERTGKMIIINTPCITLEDVTATGEYFEFAPLDERIYWREIWLERVGTGKEPASELPEQAPLEVNVP